MHPDLIKVLEECRRWGVEVCLIEHVPLQYQTPFEPKTGLCYRDRKVYLSHEDLADDGLCACLLHEMSHAIQNQPPSHIDHGEGSEITCGMLAVEYEAAKRLRLQSWEKFMDCYIVENGRNWNIVSRRTQQRNVVLSRKAAQAQGLLDRHGKPTYKKERRI